MLYILCDTQELSGPLRVVLERRDGSDGRVAVEYSTYGTNDDDPDFTPLVIWVWGLGCRV